MEMIKKLPLGGKSEIEFAGKTFVFERVNPYFLKVTSEGEERLISIEDTVEIRIDSGFYEHPYFFKWQSPLNASPKTTLKFILKLPLQKSLVVEAGTRDIVIEKLYKEGRHAWHGPVSAGELCDFVAPVVLFEPLKGDFANMPVRIVNPDSLSKEIKAFVVNPDYLILYKAENGFFTNKVYVNIVGEGEFSMSYGTTTTKAAKKAEVLIQQKTKSPKSILTSFSPLKFAREFGF